MFFPRRKSLMASFSVTGVLLLLIFINRPTNNPHLYHPSQQPHKGSLVETVANEKVIEEASNSEGRRAASVGGHLVKSSDEGIMILEEENLPLQDLTLGQSDVQKRENPKPNLLLRDDVSNDDADKANQDLNKLDLLSSKEKNIEKSKKESERTYEVELSEPRRKSDQESNLVKANVNAKYNYTRNGATISRKLNNYDLLQPRRESHTYRKILQKLVIMTRLNLKNIFSNNKPNIDFTPGYKIPVDKKRKVLIVSTWRSGSTFLGDILQSYPATFYSFEPLHMQFKGKHLEYGEEVPDAIKMIKDIYSCNFKDNLEFMKYLRENEYVVKHNTFLWNSCRLDKSFCFDPDFVEEVCGYLPLSVMKTVRLGLAPVGQLLNDTNLDLRVIHLVRDPRGTLHSRGKLKWCKSSNCIDPEIVCNDLLLDLKLAEKYSQIHSGKILRVRHEDLSLYPEKTTEDILNFIGVNFDTRIKDFLGEHTKVAKNKVRNGKLLGTYTTFRNSEAIPFAWRDKMSFEQVDQIQMKCKETLNILKYHSFESSSEYNDKNVSVINS